MNGIVGGDEMSFGDGLGRGRNEVGLRSCVTSSVLAASCEPST